ncbi:MAG: hypothetical protein U0169_06835 [Polyangiaceae bacterium]
MPRLRSPLDFAVVPFAMIATTFVPTFADAATPKPISLGEVSSVVERRGVDLRGILRDVAGTEVAALNEGSLALRRPLVMSVSIVRMDGSKTHAGSTATCVVSAVLRDAIRGDLVAVVEGSARAEFGSSRVEESELGALRGAVRGAARRVKDAYTTPPPPKVQATSTKAQASTSKPAKAKP